MFKKGQENMYNKQRTKTTKSKTINENKQRKNNQKMDKRFAEQLLYLTKNYNGYVYIFCV